MKLCQSANDFFFNLVLADLFSLVSFLRGAETASFEDVQKAGRSKQPKKFNLSWMLKYVKDCVIDVIYLMLFNFI